ncbi:hypothetical protein RvY_16812 [Ramazzottius varieornatus]|uniref:Uncharacterized protein n=1 Tax=Ramazzottius varieornatus TaxID=947166 RepID=A0A1D1W0I8_RAMVA|nr:hypothetical protein RvY_16812 [Ramazzottius varieornatus]
MAAFGKVIPGSCRPVVFDFDSSVGSSAMTDVATVERAAFLLGCSLAVFGFGWRLPWVRHRSKTMVARSSCWELVRVVQPKKQVQLVPGRIMELLRGPIVAGKLGPDFHIHFVVVLVLIVVVVAVAMTVAVEVVLVEDLRSASLKRRGWLVDYRYRYLEVPMTLVVALECLPMVPLLDGYCGPPDEC